MNPVCSTATEADLFPVSLYELTKKSRKSVLMAWGKMTGSFRGAAAAQLRRCWCALKDTLGFACRKWRIEPKADKKEIWDWTTSVKITLAENPPSFFPKGPQKSLQPCSPSLLFCFSSTFIQPCGRFGLSHAWLLRTFWQFSYLRLVFPWGKLSCWIGIRRTGWAVISGISLN